MTSTGFSYLSINKYNVTYILFFIDIYIALYLFVLYICREYVE